MPLSWKLEHGSGTGIAMSADVSDDKFHHIEYIHFMINQLQETIKYADSKHTVGMTLVISLLFAAKEFIFVKLDFNSAMIAYLYNANIISAIAAVCFGFFGIFPRFVAPLFTRESSANREPNIFYFRDIHGAEMDALKETINATFPNSSLSPAYSDSGMMEIYALSVIAMRKLRMFEWFMYALIVFLGSTFWLFLSTMP